MKRIVCFCLLSWAGIVYGQENSKQIAYDAFMNKFSMEKSLVKKGRMYKEAIANFSDRNLDSFHQIMCETYLKNKDLKKAIAVADNIKNSLSLAYLVAGIDSVDSKAAENLVKKHITEGRKAKMDVFPLIYEYSLIFAKRGRYEEAMKYADESYPNIRYKTGDMTKNYIKLLSHSKRYAEIIKLLEPEVLLGNANALTKQELERAYKLGNPGKDVAVYMQHLKKMYLVELKERITKQMISKVAPSVIGKDVNGKDVLLSDLKGKTVVIDFWATWCIPCKASFPAMQTVVNKYANDPDVAFFFLHTSGNTPDPLKDASSYLKEKGFSFNLLMDYRDPTTKKSPVAVSFGVKYLPTKLVIDGKGNIRFFSDTGFSGNDETAVDEISVMIDLTKQQ